MLPELLFSVGSSIQEMSREEYSFLNGGTIVDRDTASASNDSTLSQLKLVRTPDLEPSVTIKLEEPADAYPWLTTDLESNLLRHSEDPLLSRASDDHQQNELASIKTTISSSFPPTGHAPASGGTATCAERRKSTRSRRKGQFKLRFHHQALPQEYLEHFEASKNNQRLEDGHKMTVSSAMDTPESPQDRTNESIRNWLQKISELQSEAVPPTPDTEMEVERKTSSSSKTIKYSDLPYMGEITLENSKPRRGRKPKKADICHLIYKNYGTIFPGTPKEAIEGEALQEEPKKSELQSKIVNSLLEKRLTQKEAKQSFEEPLNLCVRDMDSVILSDEESSSMAESSRTTPLIGVPELSGEALLEPNLKMTLPNFKAALMDKTFMPETPSTGDSASGGYVYWPNANVFIHPMSLYYQKMIDSAGEKKEGDKHKSTSANQSKGSEKKPTTSTTRPSPASSSSGSSSKATGSGPHKRKRSAIFIPPIPAENATNPATEVSICKFKFTGGAKPSLQEKKMLSVDSGGNFRYYSGTGDKSMRGYEFFPRESLQQSGLMSGSSAGAFLNTPPSEKISVECMTPSEVHQRSLATPGKSSSSPTPTQRSDHRKRKSRRSLQREKLEKTFKERGFLIQTQQTESAEGATYCKFRQLKKFTRYLFRSWKDYLPGDLQQQQQQGSDGFTMPPSESQAIAPHSVPFTEVGK
ncbi:uncharacterized protein LOC132265558 [Phlebotomus argentipes]|uniref:uncharacterized protein LOC132265558 n=1 Tax=Phlebotomus argentipes TaxID=94469 RepID=UPI0028934928|nr:uncharacterized protein LOC132265558 [Phlebotomus argentipes]